MVEYPKAVSEVRVGASQTVYASFTAIEYAGDRFIGTGPGGDLVSPLTVPNTREPVGVVQHHGYWEITIGLSEDEVTLFNPSSNMINPTGDNPALGYFAITQKSTAGHTRTITYQSGKIYCTGTTANKTTNEDGKYVVEAKFICIGSRTITAWA